MTVQDAQPMDIYVDKQGKLWRCIGVCSEPTVMFEEVEGHTQAPSNNALLGGAQGVCFTPQAPAIFKDRQSGGVSGLMWDGWKRIFRNEPKPTN